MSDRPNNAFLRGLDERAYNLLAPTLKPVHLQMHEDVLESGERPAWVVFPETSLLSLISLTRRGFNLETSMAGNEGAAGLLEACGSGESIVNCVVQVDGAAWRAPAAECRALAYANPNFQAMAWRLMELQIDESRQSAICQADHNVEQRFSRWLLESFDRTRGRNPLPFTQEYLAAMLGVQRTTVSTFAAELRAEGLIAYSRGRIELLDFDGLEKRACECRAAAVAQRARLNLSTFQVHDGASDRIE